MKHHRNIACPHWWRAPKIRLEVECDHEEGKAETFPTILRITVCSFCLELLDSAIGRETPCEAEASPKDES